MLRFRNIDPATWRLVWRMALRHPPRGAGAIKLHVDDADAPTRVDLLMQDGFDGDFWHARLEYQSAERAMRLTGSSDPRAMDVYSAYGILRSAVLESVLPANYLDWYKRAPRLRQIR